MAKILVTGGAGFIGSHVVDACLEAGHDVAIVDDLSTGFKKNVPPKARLHELDIRSDALAGVFEQERPEIVLHLAAQMDVRRSLREPIFDADTNVLGSIKLLELCVKHGTSKIIYASTGGAIYGNPTEMPVPETYMPRPVSHYGCSKFAVEHYIYLYHVLYGLRFTILRFPNVYGPRQNPHGEAGVCAILAQLMLAGKTPILYGHGTPTRDYVYVGDIARANMMALEDGDGAILNLGSARGASVRELFDIVRELTGFDREPELQPLRPGEVQDIYITGDRAREVLGWVPQVTLEEGLRRTVDHIRQHGAG